MMLATLETAGGHPDTTGSDFNGPENFNLIQHFKFEFLEIRQKNIAEIFQISKYFDLTSSLKSLHSTLC